jgi:hypothetical protein
LNISLLLVFWSNQSAFAQDKIVKTIFVAADTIQFDTVSVYRTGFELRIDGVKQKSSTYYLDPLHAKLFVPGKMSGKFEISYERSAIDFNTDFSHKSTKLIVSDTVTEFDPFLYSVSSANPNDDLFGSSKLNKQGSISRGVTIGNAQNLSLQSTLNLQLDGQRPFSTFWKHPKTARV